MISGYMFMPYGLAMALASMHQLNYDHDILGKTPFHPPYGLNEYIKRHNDYLNAVVSGENTTFVPPTPAEVIGSEGTILYGGQVHGEDTTYTVTWKTPLWHVWFAAERDGSFSVQAMATVRGIHYRYRKSLTDMWLKQFLIDQFTDDVQT